MSLNAEYFFTNHKRPPRLCLFFIVILLYFTIWLLFMCHEIEDSCTLFFLPSLFCSSFFLFCWKFQPLSATHHSILSFLHVSTSVFNIKCHKREQSTRGTYDFKMALGLALCWKKQKTLLVLCKIKRHSLFSYLP